MTERKNAMRAFLSIKFCGDNRNKEHVEAVISAITSAGFEVFCFMRDAEKWGTERFTPEEMMKKTFTEIDNSDIVIADVADWPIGVGVEAGYSYAKGIPVICICPAKKSLANTVAGIANKVVRYIDYNDLKRQSSAWL
ncbi:MAG: nucleoside 2-deoxyribosyltransferase, partial [Dehalococcoidia bacterium]|nr:nucleoside 2-deoxyribosyltransferase [Dehalococcoidia bacterium]